MGVDWWVERLNGNGKRVVVDYTENETNRPIHGVLRELSSRMGRFPYGTVNYLSDVLHFDLYRVIVYTDSVDGLDESYWSDVKKVVSKLVDFKKTRRFKWIHPLCVKGEGITIGELVDFLLELLENILEEYVRGRKYGVFYG